MPSVNLPIVPSNGSVCGSSLSQTVCVPQSGQKFEATIFLHFGQNLSPAGVTLAGVSSASPTLETRSKILSIADRPPHARRTSSGSRIRQCPVNIFFWRRQPLYSSKLFQKTSPPIVGKGMLGILRLSNTFPKILGFPARIFNALIRLIYFSPYIFILKAIKSFGFKESKLCIAILP